MVVRKRGSRWCVLHSNGEGKKGQIIKCFSGKGARQKAYDMHYAIEKSKERRAKRRR